MCTLLQTYHIKREASFGAAKLNRVNCTRVVDQNEEIINEMLCLDVMIKSQQNIK